MHFTQEAEGARTKEKLWLQNELLRNWKGLAKPVYRRRMQDKLPAWLFIYHTDQILFKTASVKYSMEINFSYSAKQNETIPPPPLLITIIFYKVPRLFQNINFNPQWYLN